MSGASDATTEQYFSREVDRATRLGLTRADAPDREPEVQSREAARLLRAPRSLHSHFERAELDALFTHDAHHVGGCARRGREQQQLDRRKRGRAVRIHGDGRAVRRGALEHHALAPSQRHLALGAHVSCRGES